jgi:hypothetical protein
VRQGLPEGLRPRSVRLVKEQDRAAGAKARRRAVAVDAAKAYAAQTEEPKAKRSLMGAPSIARTVQRAI